VDLVLATSPTAKCFVVLLFTGVAAPLAGLLFRHVAGGWDSIGKGPLAIERELPLPRRAASPAVVVETERQLADLIGSP
jgi:hypothetical protein